MQPELPNPYQAPATAAVAPVPARLRESTASVDDERALFAPPALKLVSMSVSTLGF